MSPIHGRPPRRARALHLAAVATAVALLLAACGSAATQPASTAAPTPASVVPSPVAAGVTTVSLPLPTSIVETRAFGRVPVNQLVVVLADGKGPADADTLATSLDGRVVGRLEFLNAYQLETSGSSEADLAADLATARAADGVTLAAPNQGIEPADDPVEIWGTRISPMTEPPYNSGGNGDGYGLIGVQTAWDYLRGSGMDLELVKVGVVDSGLWAGTNEFDGGTNIEYTDPSAHLDGPEKEKSADGQAADDISGGHGSGVATIIGADADDGGPAGVASVLGDKLTISNTNLWGDEYGTAWTAAEPDPDDPTIVQYPGGGSYQYASLVAIMKQVNAGSTVINMSWGPKTPSQTDPAVPQIYKAFFERMSREHPEVLFVAAAGNHGQAGDGSQMYPGGFALPNVITVGNTTNDGTVWKSSNTPGNDFEVSIYAPGHQAVRGYDKDTGAVKNLYGGTSMASPQVAATAALLRSLNKKLTAEQIKQIITGAAVDRNGTPVLSVAAAVKAVIDINCDEQGIPRIDEETLLGRGVVDAVAVPVPDAPGSYTVRGIVESTGARGVDLDVSVADGDVTSGEEPAYLEEAGDATWTIALDPPDEGRIIVRRLDNHAGSVIVIETIDVNGSWAGTFTLTSITVDPEVQAQAEEQGCDVAVLQALQGTALPMTLELAVDPGSTGTSTYWIDVSGIKGSDGESLESEPQDAPVTYQGSILTFKLDNSAGAATSMSGSVTRSGGTPTIHGTVSIKGEGYSATGAWTVTKSGS